jgi:hypothetical protein
VPVPKRRPGTKKCRRCGEKIHVARKGRVPTYCSQACKQEAYHRRRFGGLTLAIDRDIADARAQAAIDARVCHALQRLGLDIRPLLPVPKTKKEKPVRLVMVDGEPIDPKPEG